MSSVPHRRQSNSVHYYQGGYDCQFVEGLDPKHECPICLLCQRDPHQTSCGHRFCYSCIITWLSEGKTCPHDNSSLGEGDIFPDSIANREIMQLIINCPNSDMGCPATLRLSDCEAHLSSCKFRPLPPAQQSESLTCTSCGDLVRDQAMVHHLSLICPNTKVACTFTSIGCTQKIPRKELQSHMASQTGQHMQLLAEKLAKVQQIQQAGQVLEHSTSHQSVEESQPCSSLPTSPQLSREHQSVLRMSGSNMHSQSRLIKELYQRVVSLEQKSCQQEIRMEQLEQQLVRSHLAQEDDSIGRYCNGSFVWKIRNFSEIHQKMRNSHSFVEYSKGFYSSVFGYKMCLRSNVYYDEGDEHLGIFLHLMKGENDDCLTWPWVGSITITIFNQREGILREHFTETMDTMPGLAAFDRPTEERNMRGFGFQEFIRVNSLYTGGFLLADNDTLIIKADVKCSGD
eukprot:GFUD01012961.1.p1 GENE.GFUD01012961.1~~GFUD01012961.1.p1  ORF type:complete len:456 (+),score=126.82 GFUD01012961.1:78-1445(+)